MKKFVEIFSLLFSFVFFMNACKKDLSVETGNTGGTAMGTVLDSLGNCQQIIVHGNYRVDSILTDSNYLLIKLNITSRGKYKVSSDSSNGFWFSDSGFVITTGLQTVKIKGHGKPLLPMVTTKTISFDSTVCQVNINCGLLPLSTNNDYFPTTVGSNWTYYYGSNLTDTSVTTVTNLYAIIGLNAYSLFSDIYPTPPNDTLIYRKDGNGNYYQYTKLLDSSSTWIDYPFLKDNLTVGSAWESDTIQGILNGQHVTMKYGFTITAQNSSFVFNGINYSNVIAVQEVPYLKLSSDPPSAFIPQTQSTDNSYYAKGIGWIATTYPSSPTYNITLLRMPNIQ